ncbi:unnamed protein product, partial [Ectocarpus sp. 12 AP-2014]
MSSSLVRLRRSALLVASGAVLGAGYQYTRDNPEAWEKSKLGLSRSAIFWSQALPIWLRYRVVQWKVDGLPEKEQASGKDEAYAPLHDAHAKEAVDIILRLKGFYIKARQASTRADFLPPQYYDRVKMLQSDTPAEPLDYIRQDVEAASLGQPIDTMFSSFEERPLGAASIGQVHRVTMKDGRQAVVKVMFPGVETMFRSDIKTMKDFCALAQPEHLVMLKEVEKQFMTEFDFREEAKNLKLVRKNMRKAWSRHVVVPEAYHATSSTLIMEYVPGKPLVDAIQEHFQNVAAARGMTLDELRREAEEKEARGEAVVSPGVVKMGLWRGLLWGRATTSNAGRFLYNTLLAPVAGATRLEYQKARLPLNTEKLIETLFRVHGHQIFVDGAFNGDPHPGNILLTPDGKLGLIDYGQVKHMALEERVKLAKLIVALDEDDREGVVRAYIDMGIRTKRMDPEVLYLHAKACFDCDHKDNLGGVNIQTYLEMLQERDPILKLSDDYVMVGRVAAILRGLGYAVKHKPSTAKLWAPQAREL